MPIEDVFYFTQDPNADDQPESGWYFWDVEGQETFGPYDDEDQATEARQSFLLATRQERK